MWLRAWGGTPPWRRHSIPRPTDAASGRRWGRRAWRRSWRSSRSLSRRKSEGRSIRWSELQCEGVRQMLTPSLHVSEVVDSAAGESFTSVNMFSLPTLFFICVVRIFFSSIPVFPSNSRNILTASCSTQRTLKNITAQCRAKCRNLPGPWPTGTPTPSASRRRRPRESRRRGWEGSWWGSKSQTVVTLYQVLILCRLNLRPSNMNLMSWTLDKANSLWI